MADIGDMFIVNTLAPVFLIIALGAVLLRSGFLTLDTLKGVNRLAYWIALPALLFHGTATADYAGQGVGRVLVVMTISAAVATLLAVIYAWRARLQPVPAGTFVHVSIRANLSFVGLPVLFYIIDGRNDPESLGIRSLAMLVLAPYLIVQNVIGIVALLAGRHRPGVAMLRAIVKEIGTHPLLISVALGVAVAWAGVKLPLALDRSLQAVGAIASPVALIAIGASLMTVNIRGNRQTALVASFLKVAVIPLLGWMLGRWFGLGSDEMLVALVFLACPTGASSFTLVAEMGGDEAVASTSIVLSTLLGMVPMALVVGLF